jgi:hypothetical protein
VIAFAGEQRFRFQLANIIFGIAELAVELFEQIVALLGVGLFLREMDVSIQVARKRSELFVGGDLVFRTLAIAQDGLRGFLIVPEIWLCDAGFEGLQTLAMWSGVKDSSEPS